jgi:Uma2 family endonuclease
MATKAFITPEQYLATHFDREPELVRGEIVERSLPNKRHSKTQQRLSVLLDRMGLCYPELRMRLAEGCFRIPDIAVFESEPEEDVPTSPPLLVIEISSPDDRFHELLEKFEDYRAWGVSNIWLVEPELKKLYVYSGALHEVAAFELRSHNLSISTADLFA